MPRGDTTGPMGQGPMTGRAAGFCAGYNVPGYGNTVPAGRGGFGRGCGFRAAGRGAGRANGRGFGFGGYATGSQAAGTPDAELSPENERDVLSRQQDYLKKRTGSRYCYRRRNSGQRHRHSRHPPSGNQHTIPRTLFLRGCRHLERTGKL